MAETTSNNNQAILSKILLQIRIGGALKRTVLYNLIVIFLYTLSGFFGLILAVPPGYATAIWAPSGIALGAVLVWGLKALPSIFISSFILNFYVAFHNNNHVFDVLNIVTGSITGTGAVLQALAGWWLVKRFVRLNNPLHIPKDILASAILTGPVSCLVASSINNIGFLLTGIVSLDNVMLNWATWWIGDSIGVLIFTPVFMIAFAKPKKLWRSRLVPILLPLCMTFFIVVIAHIFYSQSELTRVGKKFGEATRIKLNQLTDKLNVTAETAKAIALYLASTPVVKEEEFMHYGSVLLQGNPAIQSIQWVPQVMNRDEFEKKYHLKILDEKSVSSGSYVASRTKNNPSYYPILFEVSRKKNTFPRGYDYSSNAVFAASLDKHSHQENSIFSIQLDNNGGINNIAIAYAIYRKDKLSGFVILQTDLMKILNDIFGNFINYTNLIIKKNEDDLQKKPLFQHVASKPAGHSSRLFHTTYQHDFAGANWRIDSISSPYFINQEYSWAVWSSLTATLFFCVLMNIVLFILYGQRYLIQYIADAKAVQLHTEQAKNLLLLNAAGEGIFWIDTEYKISFVNQAAETLLGYASEELKDQPISMVLCENSSQDSAWLIDNTAVFHAIKEKTIIKTKEAMFWKKDGHYFWAEYTCIPIIINDMVKGAAIIFSDITERLENEIKLIKMAHFDTLTSLPNRLSFFEYLEHSLARANRNKTELGVCFIDVDNFKFINDNYGHSYGDKLLTILPEMITPSLRVIDYLARIGGDEFGLIFEDTHTINDMSKIFERILSAFDREIKIDDKYIKTSISMGISLFPKNGTDIETLLKNADIAMYHAKEMGKSAFYFYSEKSNEQIVLFNQIEFGLQQAIRDKGYEVFYHPILHANTHTLFGVEVLLRWNNKILKKFPLEESILIAEDKGFIYDLGKLIFDRSFAEFQQISIHSPGIYLAINTSVKQLENPDFTGLVQSLLEKYNINAHQICLEITETSFIKNADATIEVMMSLKRLGIQFALDDFGLGYSSIHLLKKLPVSYLKIDQSFIKNFEINPDNATIVLTSIQLSHALGIKTIAEGVERLTQLDLLKKWGCNIIQGFYFAQPMPLNELLKWIKRHEAAAENHSGHTK